MKYETRGFKIKLKPNSLEKVREWARTINSRKDEALAALCDESVLLETVFLDQTAEGDFLIGVMKAENFAKAGEAINNSVHSIDEYHRKFKRETWESRTQIELLIDLENFK